VADRNFEISDNLPNLDELILEDEIELVVLQIYNDGCSKYHERVEG